MMLLSTRFSATEHGRYRTVAKWQQKRVHRVTVTLHGVPNTSDQQSGTLADFDATTDGPAVSFTPLLPIRKAERALKMLFEPPGPLASDASIPDWLTEWSALRESADPTKARLCVRVDAATCTDESVFDPTLTHRFSFKRHFHGHPTRPVNWLMANPIGGDTNDGPRPTLGKIRNLSFEWECGTVLVTNLYTARTKDISQLARFNGIPNHPDADLALIESARNVGGVVLACGNASHNLAPNRYADVLELLSDAAIPAFGVARQAGGQPILTDSGRPVHPRVLPAKGFIVPLCA